MKVTLELTNDRTLPIVQNFFLAYFYDMTQYDDNLIINAYGLPMWQPFGFGILL